MAVPNRAPRSRETRFMDIKSIDNIDLDQYQKLKLSNLDYHEHDITVLAGESTVTTIHTADSGAATGVYFFTSQTPDATATHIKAVRYNSTTGTTEIELNAVATADVTLRYVLMHLTSI